VLATEPSSRTRRIRRYDVLAGLQPDPDVLADLPPDPDVPAVGCGDGAHALANR